MPPSPSPADAAAAKPAASSASSSSMWTLRKSLVVVLGALVALVVWSIGAEYSVLAAARSSFLSVIRSASDVDADDAASIEFYPKEVFETDWTAKIPDAEQLHLLALHSACVKHKDSVIPWHFGLSGGNDDGKDDGDATRSPEHVLVNENDADLLEKLRQCPDVDVFLPAGIRSFGYCEDAAAYTKFLQSRMLPAWVATVMFHDAERNHTFTYHDLCPNTPMLFFNHYWDGVPTSPSWPPTKPLYLMPNIEMYELEAEHYWKADVVLCKTAICARYLNKWFRQEGNPKNTQVMYTRHTTSNVALAVREQIGDDAIAPKNFSSVRFTHTAGTSIQKGTSRILDCWLKRPHFPPVDIYIAEQLYKNDFEGRFDEAIRNADNVNLHVGKLDAVEFGKVIAEGSFFLCPSFQEGYGHYINQARASGGVIVTTDVAPMNELITRDSGVLVHSKVYGFKDQFLGGKSEHPHALRGVQGFVADLRGKDVCASIDAMLSENTPRDFENMAQRAHQQFLFDTIFFAHKMQELREFARAKSHHYLRKEPASAIP